MTSQRWLESGRTLSFLAILFAVASPVAAATLPSGFSESLVASGLANPTAMQFAPDGRLFVCEQGGRLRVIKDGVLLATPFVTLSVNSSGERGLLGVAFDPEFATNHYVYVYYTVPSPVHNRISRFTANGDVAVPGSEFVLLELNNLTATNHNGGALNFGPDGKLYAAVGENAVGSNAQSMNNLLGKMLRLNADGTIPADNPFFASASGQNRAIWALGLRNPFTFAFHPDGGQMFINDVGEVTWEEINDGLAGVNYGWPVTEGMTTDPRFESPRYAYNHSAGACAITGGAFYSPPAPRFPASYVGHYFFADYCGGWIRKLDPANGNTIANFASGIAAPVDLKVADDGSLYYLARGSGGSTGVVYRIQYNSEAPTISTHPASQTVAPGSPVTFSVTAAGTPPLRYQWQRNSVDIDGATAQTYTIPSVSQTDNGAMFRVVVTNDFDNVLSNQAVLTVTANQPPTATITQPAAGALYSGGSVISYAGTAADSEDATFPGSAFTWRVDFHHDTHTHPFMLATTGATSGSFAIPTTGETAANVWYRIYLTITDSGGLTHTTFRDVLPRIARLTLATSPAGLQLRLDGQPVATPLSFDSVVGIVRNLEAASPQTSGSTSYQFMSWSDGGAAAHNISTPTVNTTYTATYSAIGTGGQRAISINFVGDDGLSMGAAESAGVVAKANWNNATGATRSTPLALNDDTGAATGTTVTWSSDNLWNTPITDQVGNRRMMKGYLDTGNSNPTTVTVAGLPAGAYDVYVYVDGDNAGANRTGAYRISGAGITATTINLTDAANTNFNAAFTQANNSNGNFVKFSINASGFTLTATPGAASSGPLRAPVNGIQIVSTAPPAPDFTIAAAPGSQSVSQGSATSYSVTIGATNGFAGTVSLAVSGLPANATASFTPPSVSGSGTATLNVTTAASTPGGSSTLTISGSSGALTHSATVTLVVNAPSTGRAISINFVGDDGLSMGAAESAGVVAKANWNNATGATRTTPFALRDDTGAATSTTLTWSSNNLWNMPITDQVGNRRMMKGYLDTGSGGATTVTVSGLPAGVYDVYVYVDGDNGSASRTGGYRISGPGITTTTINLTDAANTNFNAAFTQANNSNGNFVKFSINASGFTLTATPGTASSGPLRAPVNGIQIVPQ